MFCFAETATCFFEV